MCVCVCVCVCVHVRVRACVCVQTYLVVMVGGEGEGEGGEGCTILTAEVITLHFTDISPSVGRLQERNQNTSITAKMINM